MSTEPSAAPRDGAAPVILAAAVPAGADGVLDFLRAMPAFLVSTVIHVVLLGLFLLVTMPFGFAEARVEIQLADARIDDTPEDPNWTVDDVGANPALPTNFPVDRLAPESIPGSVDPAAAVGAEGAAEAVLRTLPPPPGVGNGQGGGLAVPGMTGPASPFAPPGGTSPGRLFAPGSLGPRSAATRARMLEDNGGNSETEAAVARALKWLALHQAPDGHWELDGFHRFARDKYGPGARSFQCECEGRGTKNDIAATGLGLLPFLAAGQTHKPTGDRTPVAYHKTVEMGVKYLLSRQGRDGNFGGGMYAHPLATIALCEAYGLTSDPQLKSAAQKAVTYIVAAQHSAGGWRYSPGQPGDTSVSGWAMMALKSGQMAGLSVPAPTLKAYEKYLDSVMSTDGGYGYMTPNPTPSMTAVGLLCRQYLGWSPRKAELMNGVARLKKTLPADVNSVYYVYYATQVMHHVGGEDWKAWNPRMQELLLKSQDKGTNPKNPHQFGSWSSANDVHNAAGGRLMMTSLCALTLEVYYRHLPLYRRDVGAMKEMDPR